MRLAVILALLSIFVLGYQNCGSGFTNDSGFFVQSENDPANNISSFGSNACYDQGGCEEDPYMMWLKVRESNPYYAMAGNSHFTISGSCGTGHMRRHTVRYILRENSGAQLVVGETNGPSGDGRCQLGLFTIPIELNKLPVDYNPVGKRFQLTVEIFGLDDSFNEIPNPSGVGRSRIEVLFEN